MPYVIADHVQVNGQNRYLPEVIMHDLGAAQRLVSKNARTLRAWRPVVIEWPEDEQPPPIANGNSHEYPCLYERDLKGPIVFTSYDTPDADVNTKGRRLFSDEQVRAIRAREGETYRAIAADYGCSAATISLIIRGKAYTDVKP